MWVDATIRAALDAGLVPIDEQLHSEPLSSSTLTMDGA